MTFVGVLSSFFVLRQTSALSTTTVTVFDTLDLACFDTLDLALDLLENQEVEEHHKLTAACWHTAILDDKTVPEKQTMIAESKAAQSKINAAFCFFPIKIGA